MKVKCFFSTVICEIIVFQSIFISRVSEDGPAALAGIQKGDKLLSVSICKVSDSYVTVNCLQRTFACKLTFI